MKHQTVETHALNRRGFLKTSGAALGAASVAGLASACRSLPDSSPSGMTQGAVILFQGDSITDAGRSRDPALTPAQSVPGVGVGLRQLGGGGTAGESVRRRIQDLQSRDQREQGVPTRRTVDNRLSRLATGCLSIWSASTISGTRSTPDRLQRDRGDLRARLSSLVERTRRALPRVKLVICEPFVLRCGAVNDRWFPEFDRIAPPPGAWPTGTKPCSFRFNPCSMKRSNSPRRIIGQRTACIPVPPGLR
jgi:hypothetical protein